MEKSKSKLLLFDVDGVILDSFEPIYRGVVAFIENHGGQGITQEQFRAFFEGNPLTNVLEAAGGLNPEDVSTDEMQRMFQDYQRVNPFDGMPELIADLAQNHVLAVVTSTPAELVTARFDALGLSQYFAAFLGPGAGVNKRHKITLALEEFGPDTGDVYFISDTSGDLLEAKDASVKTVGVTWGFHDRTTVDMGIPNHVAESPDELRNLLK